jgi:hypothetical protein
MANVCVNVTSGLRIIVNDGNCLCECYIWIESNCERLKMFMWMLHLDWEYLWTIENVYVNVTSRLRMNGNDRKSSWLRISGNDWKCLCECYIWIERIVNDWKCLCECYILIENKWERWQMLGYIWIENNCVMLHLDWEEVGTIEKGCVNVRNCLCECYIWIENNCERWKMFVWMLHLDWE